MLRIEVLTFEGCPNRREAFDRVRRALDDEQLTARIDDIRVETLAAAAERRFLGSPSIRVNGRDVEPRAEDRTEFGLMCRAYRELGRVEGVPSVRAIRAAIRKCL